MSTSFIWLIIIILLAIIEAMTINLTTIWFVFSGIAAIVVSLMTDVFVIQFATFVLVGIILLVATRPYLQRFINVRNEKTNVDRIIGMRGIVTKDIKKNKNGEVKVDGKFWTAYSDSSITVDSIVKILEIDSVKLKVEKVED